MKTNKFDSELYNELLDKFYDELYDETCSMSDEEYEEELKREQQQIDDFINNHYFLPSLRLLKLGKEYNFNMKNVFKEILNNYDNTDEENEEALFYCNEMINLSSTLKDEYICYIDELASIDEEKKNKCKDLNYYIDELDFYLMGEMFDLIEDYVVIDIELLNKKLHDEINYLNRKFN